MKTNWIKRKKTKTIYVGDIPVGGDNPISVQSMTNTDTCDVVSTVKQIRKRRQPRRWGSRLVSRQVASREPQDSIFIDF